MTRYSRYRTGWYIGLGLGGGSGWISSDSSHQTSDAEGGVGVMVLKGGIGLGIAMVGYDSDSFSGHDSTDAGFDAKLGIGHEWQVATTFNLGLGAGSGRLCLANLPRLAAPLAGETIHSYVQIGSIEPYLLTPSGYEQVNRGIASSVRPKGIAVNR